MSYPRCGCVYISPARTILLRATCPEMYPHPHSLLPVSFYFHFYYCPLRSLCVTLFSPHGIATESSLQSRRDGTLLAAVLGTRGQQAGRRGGAGQRRGWLAFVSAAMPCFCFRNRIVLSQGHDGTARRGTTTARRSVSRHWRTELGLAGLASCMQRTWRGGAGSGGPGVLG